MATEDGTRYDDLCRLCASKTNMVMGINIFENEGAIRQIIKKIETCLPVQVHERDELPKMICENCVYKLELFSEFRERSVRTENLLLNLFKEITSTKLSNNEQPLDVAEIDHSDMIMIQHHHQLLNEHEIQNVNDIDLSQLQQRDMIVEHEIILSHHNVDINAHSLDNIDLNHHELPGQDLSNQETILVDDATGVRYGEDNLHLIQQEHQLLTEQYRLQHGLHVNITEHDTVCNNITVTTTSSGHIPTTENLAESKIAVKQDPLISKLEMALKQEKKLENCPQSKTLKVETEFTSANSIVECGQADPCNNNETHLIVNSQFNDVSKERHDLYIESVIPCENSNTSVCMSANSSNDGEWLHCNMCGKSFNEKMEFQIHYEQHFNKCVTCLAVFTNRDALNAHRKEMHGSIVEEIKPIKTRLKRATVPLKKEKDNFKEESNSDSEGMNNLDNIEDEEDEDDPETDVLAPSIKRKKWTPKECKECGKTYKTNYKLAEHMRKHTGEKPYKCSSCEKAFRSKIGLAQHEAKHTGQYDLSCPTCGKGFQCKSYLMVHQRVHSDIKPYPCTTCGRNFKTKQSLLDHTNRHLGVKPYMCDICGRGFITKGLCKAHQKVHTGLDNRKYSCKVCNKMFVSKSYLQTHLRIHTGEKPFMCEVCGKGFLTRVDLRIHSTMHTGEKSYVCEMCGKAFARRDALRCHRRSHTGERPYSCDQCGQTFTQFSPMAIHKRLHTGERPYSCEVCGKAFVSRSTMMSHWKKHVNKDFFLNVKCDNASNTC